MNSAAAFKCNGYGFKSLQGGYLKKAVYSEDKIFIKSHCLYVMIIDHSEMIKDHPFNISLKWSNHKYLTAE